MSPQASFGSDGGGSLDRPMDRGESSHRPTGRPLEPQLAAAWNFHESGLVQVPDIPATWTTAQSLRDAGDQDAAPAELRSPQDKARILLAQHGTADRSGAQQLLESLGYQVTTVGNGFEALEACNQHQFDLVLMDCEMPVMDGLQTAGHLRARGVVAPVIALAATASRALGTAAGIDDWLSKPVEPAALARVVATWIAADRNAGRSVIGEAPSCDANVLRDTFLDDIPLFGRSREMFLASAPAALSEVARAIADGDRPGAAFLAHKLRGSALIVGATRVAMACAALEVSGGNTPLAALLSHVAQARHGVDAFAAATAHLATSAEGT